MAVKTEEIKKILKTKGEINGMGLLEDKKYILEHFGETGLKKVEKEISNIIGEEFSYKNIKSFTYYPLYLSALVTLILHYDFGLDENGIREFGKEGAKVSLIIKLFLRHIVSIDKIPKYAEGLWKKYIRGAGKLTIEELNQKEKRMIIKIENFEVHQLYCKQIEGVIYQLFSYISKSTNLKVGEIECTFKGGKSHRFAITW
jgi:hypothetical protein